METVPTLRTRRLLLRPWRMEDLHPLASMNADSEVMRYFPAVLDRQASAAMMARNDAHVRRHGFGWWAIETPGGTDFAGAVSLQLAGFEAHFTPCFEIGWRLPKRFWGMGYASEAANVVANFAFDDLLLDKLIAMTAHHNHRSRKVMRRLGMSYRPEDDFGHPLVAFDHPLRHHVLYRLSRNDRRDTGSGGGFNLEIESDEPGR
ncbi:MAG: GNAT family N-acetyltransferase [Geminicoccaceae bacterium]